MYTVPARIRKQRGKDRRFDGAARAKHRVLAGESHVGSTRRRATVYLSIHALLCLLLRAVPLCSVACVLCQLCWRCCALLVLHRLVLSGPSLSRRLQLHEHGDPSRKWQDAELDVAQSFVLEMSKIPAGAARVRTWYFYLTSDGACGGRAMHA